MTGHVGVGVLGDVPGLLPIMMAPSVLRHARGDVFSSQKVSLRSESNVLAIHWCCFVIRAELAMPCDIFSIAAS